MYGRPLLLILFVSVALAAAAQTADVQNYRTLDGSQNNLSNPNWGAAGTDLLQFSGVGYANAIKGKSRDLPLIDDALRDSISEHLAVRLGMGKKLKPSDPLFLTQKGVPYSPNTLQEHMALMLRRWAGIEKASSHSGRRSVITNVIHKQKKSVKVAQKIAGHVNPSTTLIYEEPPEEQIGEALKGL